MSPLIGGIIAVILTVWGESAKVRDSGRQSTARLVDTAHTHPCVSCVARQNVFSLLICWVSFAYETPAMPESFIFIPGRTSRQGTGLNQGKYSDEYLSEIGTLQVNPDDMKRMNLKEGDRVRVWSDLGQMTVPIKAAKGDELPSGMLFIGYGMQSSLLMGGETHGTGMPDSKGMDVWMEKAHE